MESKWAMFCNANADAAVQCCGGKASWASQGGNPQTLLVDTRGEGELSAEEGVLKGLDSSRDSVGSRQLPVRIHVHIW